MSPEEFRRVAGRMLSEIPEVYRQGVDALVVETEPVSHPEIAEVFTMGECVSEVWASGYGDDDLRSRLVLYYGSFRELAAREPDFDWEAELWETILHELLHHREWAAGEQGLDVYDWVVDQNQRRHAGLEFDPEFWRALPASPEGAVRVESEMFVEAEPADAGEDGSGDGTSGGADGRGAPGSDRSARAGAARFRWRGRPYVVPLHEEEATHVFVNARNLAGGRLWAVVRRPVGRLERWKRWLGLSEPRVVHEEAWARPAAPADDAGA